jgi:5-methyltetrahydrofolate--homocysteine methyltransferase
MELVKDRNNAQARWEAWWDGTLDTGPLISVVAPLDQPRRPLLSVSDPVDVRERWLDVAYRTRTAWNQVMSTWYGGDALPNVFINFGPGSMAAYLGSEVTLMRETVWFHPLRDMSLKEIESSLRYDPENELWQATLNFTREAAHMAEKEFFVSIADIGSVLDILASLRGNQNLLLDIIESPGLVNRCQDRIMEFWFRCYSELRSIIDDTGQEGHTCWLGCWSSRPWYVLQCDFSAMISSAMFEEFVVPYLEQYVEWLDRSVYHWDGPGALHHLRSLLSIERLNAIQWVAGAGNPPEDSETWLPQYRKIAEAGKGIIINGYDPDRVVALTKKLPAEKLAISVQAPSPKDGEALLKRLRLAS